SYTVGTTWRRFSVSQTFSGATTTITPTIFPGTAAGADTQTVYAWGGQLVSGSVPQVYVRTVGGTQAANAGVVSNGGVFISANSATDKPLVVQAAASPSGDLFEMQDSTGAIMGRFDSSANLRVASAVDTQTSTTLSLGTSQASAITVGGTGTTGTITLGQYNGASASTINIGTNAGASTTQNINIGTSVVGTNAVAIGSTGSGSSTILKGDTSNVTLNVNGVLVKGSGNAAGAFAVQDTSSNSLLTVDTLNHKAYLGSTGASALAAEVHIADTTASAQSVTVGSLNSTSATLIQGGTGASAIGVQAGSGGTISIGTVNNNNIAIGTAAVAGTITLGGTGTTGTMTLGQSTDTNTINIGNANTANTKTQTINIGNGTEAGTGKAVVTIGNSANASQTTIQGGSGGIGINTGAASGSTGSIIIQTGDSSGSTSGNISIDNGAGAFNSGTSALNDTFEASPCSSLTTDFVSWFGLNVSNSTPLVASNAQAHGGTCSVAATEDGGVPGNFGFWGITDAGNNFTVVGGQQYTFSAWVRSTLAQRIDGDVQWSGTGAPITLSSVNATTTGWTQITGSAVAPSDATYGFFEFASGQGNNTSTTYFDDITVTANSGAPAIDLGTGNAQTINIGNGSMQGGVNIQGGTSANAVNIYAGVSGTINIANSTRANTLDLGAVSNDVASTVNINSKTGGSAVKNVNIGSTDSTSATLIQGGSGATAVSIQAAASGTINVGTTNANTVNVGAVGSTANASTINIANTTGNATQSINIGATNSANNAVLIQGGTGASAISVQAGSGGTISVGTANNNSIAIGTAATTGTVSVGGTGTTGTITLGQYNGASTSIINIGANAGASSTQQVNIASSASGINTVAIGSTNSTSVTTIKGGSGSGTSTSGALVLQVASGGAINVGNTAASKTINIGSTAALAGDSTINIGSSSSNVQALTLGSTNSTSSTTIQGGTAAGAIALSTGAAGTVTVTTGNNGSGTAGNITLTTGTSTSGNASIIAKSGTNSTAAFQVQNSSGNEVFKVDTSTATGQVILGKASTNNAQLQLFNSSGSNSITILSGNTSASGGTGYTLTLPLTGGSGSQCLLSTGGSTVGATTLIFGSCAGGSTLQTTYNNSAGASPSILETAANGPVTIQNANSSGITGSNELFGVHDKHSGDTIGNSILSVTADGKTSLGADGALAGTLVLNSATASKAITVTNATGAGGSAYTLTLPPAGSSTGNLCLEAATGSTSSATTLQFGSCAIPNASITHVNDWQVFNNLTLTGPNPTTVGDLMVVSTSMAGGTVTGISGGGVTTWIRAAINTGASGTTKRSEIWFGTVTATGASNIVITGETGNNEIVANEFTAIGVSSSTTYGVDVNSTNNGSSATATFPNLTAQSTGELYYGYGHLNSNYSTGSTSGFTYYSTTQTSFNDVVTYNPTLNGATSYQPTATQASNTTFDTTAAIFTAYLTNTAINNSTSLQAANFYVQAASSGSVAGVLQANNADILDFLNTSGVLVGSVGSTGNVLVEPSTNSASAFQIQNSTAKNVLQVDTSGNNIVLGQTSNVTGNLQFANASSANLVTVNAGNTTNAYSLTLPTTGSNGNLCLESSTTSTTSAVTLQFANCANSNASISHVTDWDFNGSPVSSPQTVAPTTVGDLMVISAQMTGGTFTPTNGTGGVTTWTRAIINSGSGGTTKRNEIWFGTVTTAGSTSLSFSGMTGQSEIVVSEFTAVGVSASTAYGVDISSTNNAASSTTITYPSLQAQSTGELYYGYAQAANTASSGGTSGFTYYQTSQTVKDLVTYNPSLTGGQTYAPTGSQSLGAYNTTAAIFVAYTSNTAINNTTSIQAANFYVQAATAGSVAGTLQANGSGNILNLLDSNGNLIAHFANNGTLVLGDTAGTINGSLVFQDGSDSNAVTINAPGTVGSAYSLTLPSVVPGPGLCLGTSASNAQQLVFSTCTQVAGAVISYVNEWDSSTNAVSNNNLTVVPASVGDLMILVSSSQTTAPDICGVQGGGVTTWTRVTSVYNGLTGANKKSIEMWRGVVTSAGSAAIYPAWGSGTFTPGSGTNGTCSSPDGAAPGNAGEMSATEYTIGNAAASWNIDVTGTSNNSTSTNLTMPTLTPQESNEMYVGYGWSHTNSAAASNGTPASFSYVTTTHGTGSPKAQNMWARNGAVNGGTPVAATVTQSSGTSLSIAAFIVGFGSNTSLLNTTQFQSGNFDVQSSASGNVTGILQANNADILDLYDTGGSNLTNKFDQNGYYTQKTFTNSASAFQVQNSSGSNIFNIDTSKGIVNSYDHNIGAASNVGAAGRLFSDGFETGNSSAWATGVTGGTTGSTGTLTYDTTTVRNGKYSFKGVTSTQQAYDQTTIPSSSTLYAREYFNVTSLGNPTQLMDLGSGVLGSGTHLYVKLGASGNLCYVYNGGADQCSATAPSTSAWHKLEVKYVAGSGANGTLQVYLDNTLVTSGSNALNTTTGAWTFNVTNFSLGTNVNSTATVFYDDVALDTVATGDSASAYVQDSLHVAGTSTFSDNVLIAPTNSAGNALLLQANSASAVQIQNSNNSNVLEVDTTDSNRVTNPSFDSGYSGTSTTTPTGWTATGTGASISVNTNSSFSNDGRNSATVVTGTTANGGAVLNTFTTTPTGANTWTLSFYAMAADTSSTGAFNDLSVVVNGITLSNTCNSTLNSTTVGITGFQRYTCTFTSTSGTMTNISIGESGTTSHTFYIDDVQLIARNGATQFGVGALLFGGLINSPLQVSSSAKSANAFQVQNASGTNVMNIDTTDTNILANPGFEPGIGGIGGGNGWTSVAGGGTVTITRDTSQAYLGNASLKVAITGAGTSGAKYNLNPIVTTASTSYTVSFYALWTSGTAPTFSATYSPDNSATSTCVPTSTTTISASGWTRFSCSGLTSATTPTTSGYIQINQSNSATSTWYIDAVQLETGSTATPYGSGAITLDSVVSSPAMFQNSVNSTTAFQVANQAGNSTLNVDTLNNNVTLGKASTLTGNLQFANSSSANLVTLNAGTTSSSYSLALPTTGASGALCLAATSGSTSTSTALQFTACGSSFTSITHVNDWQNSGTSITTLADAPATQGNLLVVSTQMTNAVSVSSISGGGVTTWTRAVTNSGSGGTTHKSEIWFGTVTTTGAGTITITYSAAAGVNEIVANEFTATGANVNTVYGVDLSSTNNGSSATVTYPSMVPQSSGELYYGYGQTSSNSSAGATSGFSYFATSQASFNDMVTYNPNVSGTTAYQPTHTQASNTTFNTTAAVFQAYVSGTSINNSTSTQQANFNVQAANSGSVAGVLQANAAGTGDILDLVNGAGTTVGSVGSTGSTLFKTSTNSTTGFQVQNSSGTNVLVADTTNEIVSTTDLNVGAAANSSGAGRLFSDTFETGNANMWASVGGTASSPSSTNYVVSTTARNGKYAFEANDTSGHGAYAQTPIAPSSTLFGRTYFDTTTTNNPTPLMDFGTDVIDSAGTTKHLFVYLGASGNLCYNYNNGAATACSSTAPSTSTWHKLEVKYVAGTGANGVLQVFLDNTQVTTNSNAINISNGTWTGSITNFAIGGSDTNTTATSTTYYDDVSVDSVATGDSASLYLQDSLHVGGTSNFNDTLNVSATPTITTNGGNYSGQLLNISRSATANVSTSGAAISHSTSGSFPQGKHATGLIGAQSLTPQASGDIIFWSIEYARTTCSTASITYASAGTWTKIGTSTDATHSDVNELWYAVASSTSANNFSYTTQGTSCVGAGNNVLNEETWDSYHTSGSPTWNIVSSSHNLFAGNANGDVIYPTLSATATNQAYFGQTDPQNTYTTANCSVNFTCTALESGFEGIVRNTSLASGTSYTPTANQSTASSYSNNWGVIFEGDVAGGGGANITGSVANFTDSCTNTGGTCNTTGNVVNINQSNTNATGSALQIQQSNSSTAVPIETIKQASTGDATIQYQNSVTSFYEGIDTSNNAFTINSKDAATYNAVLGENFSTDVADTPDSGNNHYWMATKFTSTATGSITNINVAIDCKNDSNSNISAAIFADDSVAGLPGNLLGKKSTTQLITGAPTSGCDYHTYYWQNIQLDSAVPVINGTIYWLSFSTSDAGTEWPGLGAGGTNTTAYRKTITDPLPNWTNWGASGATDGTSNAILGIYANVESTGVTDTNANALFSLTSNGSANFRSVANANSQFVIQNSSATNMFQVDSTNNDIYIGSSTADAIGVQLVLDTKNTSGDPAVGVNGGMYYNSNTSKFRCYQASAWRDCLSPWITVTKTANQDVTNSSTFADDNTLQFAVTSGNVYNVKFNICYAGTDTTGDYKGQFLFPAAIAVKNVIGSYTTTDGNDAALSSSGVLGSTTTFPAAATQMGAAASSSDKREFQGQFSVQPNSSGTLKYQFAEFSAQSTKIARTCANSFIEYSVQ
ncbi:MAG TPA: hypothetical protein VLG47_08050, partial [Candidatus Saccharimonadales bacterium]|nr:hypothetical protein [Candidatus Saccharimonadales bacterium]